MEQIYTIPVNEAFESCAADSSLGCPFCRLYGTLESNELELILGASMMEPDIRKKTNEQGFCARHWEKLSSMGKRLPLALILQSHLAQIDKMMKKPGLIPAISGAESAKKLSEMSCDCYICRRISFNFANMIDTAAILWESDGEFRKKLLSQSGFCIPHFTAMCASAKKRMKSKSFAMFYKDIYSVEKRYTDSLKDNIDSFAKRFDYRFDNNAGNGNDAHAIEDAIKAL